jgi:hypothetical protein
LLIYEDGKIKLQSYYNWDTGTSSVTTAQEWDYLVLFLFRRL